MPLIIPNKFATRVGSIQLAEMDENFQYLASEFDRLAGGITISGTSTSLSGNLSVAGTSNFTGLATAANLTVTGSLTLSGTSTAPTAAAGTSTTQLATTQFVTTGLNGKVNNINITAATVGSSTAIPVITYNAQGQITNTSTAALSLAPIDSNQNITFDGTPTTITQNRGIFWTAYDKEGTTDFSDVASIRHTTNTGGLTGSVLEIKSFNDAEDGVNFSTGNNDGVRINGNKIWNSGNQTTSLSSNGYITLPNGLIMQWCTGGAVSSETDITTSFPIAFPNACLNVVVGTYMPSGDRDGMFQMRYYDRFSVTARFNQFNSAGGTGYPTVWAIGY